MIDHLLTSSVSCPAGAADDSQSAGTWRWVPARSARAYRHFRCKSAMRYAGAEGSGPVKLACPLHHSMHEPFAYTLGTHVTLRESHPAGGGGGVALWCSVRGRRGGRLHARRWRHELPAACAQAAGRGAEQMTELLGETCVTNMHGTVIAGFRPWQVRVWRAQ